MQIARLAIALFSIVALSSGSIAAELGPLWLHPKTSPLPTDTMGPFVRLPDGPILAVSKFDVLTSYDEGLTWASAPLDTGMDFEVSNERALLVTREGTLILACLNRPGRHSVLTYASTDQGATWKPSNIVDLGGNGHHGGATEATVLELNDGRLWKLIRTNLGVFWQAWSEDGFYWRTMAPTTIPASSAPGQLLRLQSGRIALVWNRPYPEGETSFPLRGGDNEWSETPVSNHRWELSLAFSNDEGQTWTDPVVLAKQKEASLAYPYLFERAPGEIWLTTMQGGIRLAFREADFVE
jgi:sialidase-1